MVIDKVRAELSYLSTKVNDLGFGIDLLKEKQLILVLQTESPVDPHRIDLFFEDEDIQGTYKKDLIKLKRQPINHYSPLITIVTYDIEVENKKEIPTSEIEKLQPFKDIMAMPYIKYVSSAIQKKNGTYAFEIDENYILPFFLDRKPEEYFSSTQVLPMGVFSSGYVRDMAGQQIPKNILKFNTANIKDWYKAFDEIKNRYELSYLNRGKLLVASYKTLTHEQQLFILKYTALSHTDLTPFHNGMKPQSPIPFSRIANFLDPNLKLTAQEKSYYEDLAKNHGLKWKDISSFLDDEILHTNRSRIKMQSLKDI